MTRLYLKIFFTFWLITAVIIVGTNLVVHWFDITPDGNLQHNNNDDVPTKRLLFQMVGNAVNRNTRQLTQDLQAMPSWSTRYAMRPKRAGVGGSGRCKMCSNNAVLPSTPIS